MRQLLPKPPVGGTPNPPLPPPPARRGQRREQASIACDTCRRRKIKCDNRRPVCSPCASRESNCHFSDDTNALKEVHRLVQVLRDRSEDESAAILHSIRRASSVHDAVQTFADTTWVLSDGPGISNSITSPTEAHHFQRPQLNSSFSSSIEPLTISDELVARFPDGVLPVAHWTALSVDNRYLTHLLNLFFTWDSTLGRIFSRDMFLKDMKSQAASDLSFCSKFLVHSVLAVSHLYISQKASPNQLEHLRARARTFANEALRMLPEELSRSSTSVTLAQGLALLWVYEVNDGNEAQSLALLEEFYRVHNALIVDINKHYETQDVLDTNIRINQEAVSFIMWGFFCLEMKISLSLSRAMRISPPAAPNTYAGTDASILPDFQATSSWYPYPSRGESHHFCFRELVTFESQLAELAREASWFFALSEYDRPLPGYHATRVIYTKLLAWNAGRKQRWLLDHGMIPSVLVLDITFETILLKLLNCFCRSPDYLIEGQTPALLRASYGASIISNLWAYRSAYGIRHEPWLIQVCLCAATAVLQSPEYNTVMRKTIAMACQLLFDMGEHLPMGHKCLLAVKALARRQDIVLPASCRAIFSKLAAETRIITVRDARLFGLGLGASGDDSKASERPCHAFSFSSNILGSGDLSAGRSGYDEE